MGQRDKSYSTQIIDGAGKFNTTGIEAFVKNTKLNECGLSYVLVSIMGAQSSGKSTLANHLFRTKFRTMNGEDGRTQTTRGIWMANCVGVEPFTIVMDLEGTDGQEKEDDTLFERQSSLFALAVSDVILINMWCTEVGREHGAGKPLLRIVFKEMIKLNKSTRRKTLMFVIRDKSVTTPLKRLEEQLTENVEKIWNSALESLARKEPLLNDCFTVEVQALAHYEFQKDKFIEQVAILRQRFFNSIEPGGVAEDRNGVDYASFFSVTTEEIWKQIQQTKELDLPATKIMVAKVLCQEISNAKYSSFEANKTWRHMKASAQAGPVSGFGKNIDSLILASLSEYDKDSIGLYEEVRIEERKELQKKLLELVRPAFCSILEHISTEAEDEFVARLNEPSMKNPNIYAAAKECKAFALEAFSIGCEDAVSDLAEWDIDISRENEKLKSFIIKHTSEKQAQREQEEKLAFIEEERIRLWKETETIKHALQMKEKELEHHVALAKRNEEINNERAELMKIRYELLQSEQNRQRREELATERIRARAAERSTFGKAVKEGVSLAWSTLTLDPPPPVYYKMYKRGTSSGKI